MQKSCVGGSDEGTESDRRQKEGIQVEGGGDREQKQSDKAKQRGICTYSQS